MSNMMDFATFKNCAEKLPARVSVLLRGDHGIGKSQSVFQLGEYFALTVIDRRLSQMSEGDMIGLPKIEDGVTKFLPPDWYMEACREPRVLFLDELNRATPEVMQAAFQIVLDRQLNGHRLHPESRVYAAINASHNYSVNEVDPALLDRFWVVDLKPSAEDWTTWADGKLHRNTVNFIKANPRFLDPTGKDPGAVEPSRRSWERLDATLMLAKLADEPENPLFYNLSRGFVGSEASIAYTDFVKNQERQVKAEEILFGYEKVRDKVMSLGQEKWNICIDKIDEYVKEHSLNDETARNLGEFAKDLPSELVVVLWTKIAAPGAERLEQVKLLHKYTGQLILKIYAPNATQGNNANSTSSSGSTTTSTSKKKK